ncbi:MAG: zinc ribbon domain-containing protein [Candidatus Wildermuthbacteria bacterium]|nr:zinc ribbon domain-containing protein [Candidatus Wildermuthbacteria bacterium]
MPIIKCLDCGKEYEVLAVIHDCPKRKNAAVSEEEKKEWEKKSSVMKFFGYAPGLPSFLRFYASTLAVSAAAGLALAIFGVVMLIWGRFSDAAIFDSRTNFVLTLYGSIGFIAAAVFSYGIANMKKWILYAEGAAVILLILIGFLLGDITIPLFGLAPFLVALLYRKKFVY